MSKQNSALLVMDLQPGIIAALGADTEAYLARVQTVVDAARQNGVRVYFVVVRFRKGYPEVGESNKSFSAIRERYSQTPLDDDGPNTQPVIKPTNDELVVAKKRVSAFAGSDLEMLLRAQNTKRLILCGIATSGVVLSTLRYAADMDYEIAVLSDCCADSDLEINSLLLDKVFPRQAEVLTSAEWVESLNQSH